MLTLPPLYHWAPASRRQSIAQHGLLLNSPNTISTHPMPYICLGTDPRTAWAHSAGTLAMSGQDLDTNKPWDLWQINVGHGLPIYPQPEHGPHINEIRISHDIPPSMLWWCGVHDPNTPNVPNRTKHDPTG